MHRTYPFIRMNTFSRQMLLKIRLTGPARIGLLALLVAAAAIGALPGKARIARTPAAPMPGLQGGAAADYLKQQGLYNSLGEAMKAARYGVYPSSPRDREQRGEAFHANNPEQRWRAGFTPEGLSLSANSTCRAGWEIGMKLSSVGYGSRQMAVSPGRLSAKGARIEYERGVGSREWGVGSDQQDADQSAISHKQWPQSAIVEWYVNKAEGLEQGFTLAAPVAEREGDEPLVLRLELTGDLRARAEAGGQSVTLLRKSGARALSYDHLEVVDAQGRKLAAHLEADGGEVRIVVDDRGASYPVTIDPTFTEIKKLTAPDGAAGDLFGFSVAIYADTAIVGAHGDDGFIGAAYIFQRNQGGSDQWGEVMKLTASNGAAGDLFGASVAIYAGAVIIGALFDDVSFPNQGSAYIFVCGDAPTISAVPVVRQQGSPSANSTIANVSDAEDPPNTLMVTVNGGASATVNGVTVSNILVSPTGVVTADVVASCTASNANFTLRVTDSSGQTAEATLTVTVTPNTPPVLSYSSPQFVISGNSKTINPATGPSDNGAVTGIVVQSQGTFTGGVSVNAAGVVSINNAAPAGSHTITIRATDNCGATTDASFILTVPLRVNFSLADPLACTGPGNKVAATATVTNSGAVSLNVTLNFALPPQLLALPGTCTSNIGSCSVVNASTVAWSGALGPGQTATVSYQAQVGDQATPGTQLCVTTSVGINGVPSGSVQACVTVNCPPVGPGLIPNAQSPVSDQKAGSVLFYNLSTSSASSPHSQDTRITMTNIHPALSARVHLFFVDGANCSVADSTICLTPNQTMAFLASDFDPGTTGYIVAVAVDLQGCPTNFNYLIGDEYVKLSTGHAANLGAEAFSALAGGLPLCNGSSVTAQLNFDGISYNQAPRVLALDNIPSRADGNDTLLVLNRFGGDLTTGAARLTSVFGVFYNDTETGLSFTFNPGLCQFRSSVSNNFPRIVPRFETFVPAGQSGWLKFYSTNDQGILGAAINFNGNAESNANAFNQGHNLHKLRLTSSATLTIPIFPPAC